MKSLSEDFALTLTYDFEFVPVAIELYKLITPYLQPVGYRHMWFNRSEIKPVGNNLKRSTMNFTFGFGIWFKVTAQHYPKALIMKSISQIELWREYRYIGFENKNKVCYDLDLETSFRSLHTL